jgi:hypothetical protein
LDQIQGQPVKLEISSQVRSFHSLIVGPS